MAELRGGTRVGTFWTTTETPYVPHSVNPSFHVQIICLFSLNQFSTPWGVSEFRETPRKITPFRF